MKKQILSILLVLALSFALLPQLVLPSDAQTLTGTCGANGDNLTWTLDKETGVLTIAGSGEMEDYSVGSGMPWYGSRDYITKIVVSEGVTGIGGRAFFGLKNVTEVTLPNGLLRIGTRAFGGCRGLTGIAIPAGITTIESSAFNGCSSLESVTVPLGVTSIGDSAFSGCSSLRQAALPEGLTEIRDYTFYNCDDLVNVTIPVSVTRIGDYAFEGCEPWMYIHYNGTREMWDAITIGSNNDVLSSAALYCTVATGTFGGLSWTLSSDGLLTVTGSGPMEFGEAGVPWGTWEMRNQIKSVVLSEGVTSIGNYAFSGCTRLTSVLIPASVTSIGDGAFSGCTGLTSVLIPASVTSIGAFAFNQCSGLTKISVDEGNASFSSDEAGILFDKEKTTLLFCPLGYSGAYTIPDSVTSIGYSAFYDCTSLTDVTIGSGVTSIGEKAFSGCSGLTGVTIPDSVTSIGYSAFYDCTSLTDVMLGSGVTSISDSAFEACIGLTSVTIPDSVTSIGDYAFYGCTSLTDVILGSSMASIGNYAFYSCSSLARISVAEENTSYSSDEAGILFDKEKTTLLYCPLGYSGAYTIPASVTDIGDFAFSGCSGLTSLTIPTSVTGIGDSAFEACIGLTSVTIPDSVTSIGRCAFISCAALQDVSLPQNMAYVGPEAFCYTAFSRNPANWQNGSLSKDHVLLFYNLEESDYRIPDGIYLIADEVFDYADYNSGYYADSLAAQERAANAADAPAERSAWVTFDEFGLIYPTENLTVYVPSSVRRISGSLRSSYLMPIAATQHYPFQPKVQVDPQNECFCSDPDGALFTKDMTKLISCPSVRTGVYTVPESVDTVGSFAFADSDLGTVILPQSVTRIEGAAFEGSSAAVFILNPDCTIEAYEEIDWGAGTSPLVMYDSTLGNGLICSYHDSVPEAYVKEHDHKFYRFYALPDGFTADNVFLDVNGSSYYMEPVMWAVANGVTNGTGERLFSPQATCTRGQVATFLWRANGCPEPASTVNPFKDVKTTDYFYKAVLWAKEKGITTGTDATHFSPNDGCTRGQVVTFLWRSKGKPAPTSTENPFMDVRPNEYYTDAVLWAVEKGITNGTDFNKFSPNATCTRGQIVTFLFRDLA